MTTVRVLGGLDARVFLAAPDRWRRLLRGDEEATAFQAPAYLSAYGRHLGPSATPLILVAEDAAAPVAALALVRQHLHDRSRITALGNPDAEYVRAVGPGAEDRAVAAAFAQQLQRFARQGEAVRISDVPLDSALGQHLVRLPGWGVGLTSCATVALPVDYRSLSPATRRAHSKRRATWLRLERERTVEFKRCVGSAVLPAWEALLGLYRAQRGRRPSGERELLDVIASPNVFIAQLCVDGTPVAADLCLTRGRRVYSLLPAMSPAWSEEAAGHALLRYLATDLARKDSAGQRSFTSLDLGRTREQAGQRGYKAQYAPEWSSTVTASSVESGIGAGRLAELQGAA